MCSAAIKTALLAGAMAIGLSGCSFGDKTAERAGQLLTEAQQLKEAGNYEAALAMLDSIDRTYPSATDVRREALGLRPLLVEQMTNRQLQTADSLSVIMAYRLDSLSKTLQQVSNPVENYFVPRSEGHVDVGAASGLHGRMAPDGRFYLVATSPSPAGTTTVTVTSGGDSASTPAVAYDGERNERNGAHDVITFVEGECQEVGELIMNHRDDPVTVTFSGSKSVSMTLPEQQRRGLADVFEVAKLVRERKKQEIEKQKLERLLDVARRQVARTHSTDSI